jgi:hypothetical protein
MRAIHRLQTRQPNHSSVSITASNARKCCASNPRPPKQTPAIREPNLNPRFPCCASRAHQFHFHKLRCLVALRLSRPGRFPQPLFPGDEMWRTQPAFVAKRSDTLPTPHLLGNQLSPTSPTRSCFAVVASSPNIATPALAPARCPSRSAHIRSSHLQTIQRSIYRADVRKSQSLNSRNSVRWARCLEFPSFLVFSLLLGYVFTVDDGR